MEETASWRIGYDLVEREKGILLGWASQVTGNNSANADVIGPYSGPSSGPKPRQWSG